MSPRIGLRSWLAGGLLAAAGLCLGAPVAAQSTPSFVNWESPHVHPLDLTPDRLTLLAVNTADARLEVFDVSSGTPIAVSAISVGLDPVSVRARTNTECWVVNQISDSVSIVDLAGRRIVRTLACDDEPADVVFANNRAFVSCSQANTVLVFDLGNLGGAPTRLEIVGEHPRALAVSPDGTKVYAAIFHSGNSSTVIGGITPTVPGSFPPNTVGDPSTPHGGQNPFPNGPGNTWVPPFSVGLPTPPPVALILKKDAGGLWRDDTGADWSAFVSGAQAAKSGRPVGWDLADHDVAVIQSGALSISYAKRLMNICMSIAVVPGSGDVVVIGTEATNEIRFEPVVNGSFVRVKWARIGAGGAGTPSLVDLNPHLDYQSPTIAQSERDKSIGDPRALAFRADGSRAYAAGMGSNNVVVLNAQGQRAGVAPTIAVGSGPTGLALDESASRLYVLARFDAAISVIDTQSETEVARVGFHDATPSAIRNGRRHLYATRATSGLGQASCASCHVDGRVDRMAWDLGDPSGIQTSSTLGQNLGGNVPGLNTGPFSPFHPMKGPMVTQTFLDIIGKEPLHWRGDRKGIENFNGAFVSLLGDDAQLSSTEMQEFEDYLATLTFPPNPYRAIDNTLRSSLTLPGHFTTGRFGPAGLPLPTGNPQRGLALYRPPNLLDGNTRACVSCHTLPTGIGTNFAFNPQLNQFAPFPVGPAGERHHAIVAGNGVSTITLKVPQLRTLADKRGFNTTQLLNTAGFGLMHDGTVDSIERLVSEPIFTTANDQDVADLVAFMLSFSGSGLPNGTLQNVLEPPGTSSNDTHAAVGMQVTVITVASTPTALIQKIATLTQLAAEDKIGVIAHVPSQGLPRGFFFDGTAWQSDRFLESWSTAQLLNAAAVGNELTITAVARGTQMRLGVDRDLDGVFDRDELDQGTDPADPDSFGGGCQQQAPSVPSGLVASLAGATTVHLNWSDNANNETSYRVEREANASGLWSVIATLPPDSTNYIDDPAPCSTSLVYRVSAVNCAGTAGSTMDHVVTSTCCGVEAAYCIAKLNSLGCLPMIAWTGTPSASQPAGFQIRASEVRNNKNGLLFYGVNGRENLPYQGGTLCVKPPIRRTPSVNSGGTLPPSNDCTGVFAFDMNAFAAGALGGNPLPALQVPGTLVQCQWWGRDPGFLPPNNTTLSSALEFTVCP